MEVHDMIRGENMTEKERDKERSGGERKSRKKRLFFKELRGETRDSIFAIFYLALTLIFLLAGLDRAGSFGKLAYRGLHFLLGWGYFLIPLLCFMLSLSFARSLHHEFKGHKLSGALLFLLSALGVVEMLAPGNAGILGGWVASPLLSLLDVYGSFIVLFACAAVSLLMIFDIHLRFMTMSLPRPLLFFRKKKGATELDTREEGLVQHAAEKEADEKKTVPEEFSRKNVEKKIKEEDDGVDLPPFFFSGEPFIPPPLSLLESDRGKPDVGDIKANANIIKRTLSNFSIPVEMDEITIGPSVTRYSLKPAEGVRLSKIVALQRDLELALAASPVRIEAPIPGKSLVGIEVPNTLKSTVGLATMLSANEFQESKKPLLVAIGKAISGTPIFANIAKMPHLLIAGATGSGKSVSIHSLITSLLYRNSPDIMRFIMIDPKRVELTLYNKIPHLLTPVITDPKKSILALKWAGKEMARRYDILESEKVRDIDSYHKNILFPALEKVRSEKKSPEEAMLPEPMPYIVVIIDELADIMQSYPRELEAAIVRLAQMSRAVGIHLLLSTQRPSVNIITGLIKANIPARMALQVASQIDSRTILDMGGAEKLLGGGDMLYLSGEMTQPSRIQSPFISETEVKQVVKFLVEQSANRVPDEITIENGSISVENSILGHDLSEEESDIDDDLYEEARLIVMEAGKASTSYLQRKLRLGYARAARIMDVLEERGVIGPADGSRPREVIGRNDGIPTENVEPNEHTNLP